MPHQDHPILARFDERSIHIAMKERRWNLSWITIERIASYSIAQVERATVLHQAIFALALISMIHCFAEERDAG